MIKINMDMPMTCEQCRFYDGCWCLAKHSEIYANSSVERDTDCPLIEEQTGEWMKGKHRWTCLNCRSTYKEDGIMNYCPWCGAKMVVQE